MTGRVAQLQSFHETNSFGSRENLARQQEEAANLYRDLKSGEVREHIEFALGTPAFDGDLGEMILLSLACLHPGSLDGFHDALLDRGILYPPVIWQGAGADVARRMIEMLPGEDSNHLLLALAWIGDESVQKAFRRWRDEQPEWAVKLHVSPHRYAEEAGWQLTDQGSRLDLFPRTCHPLVRTTDKPSADGIVEVVSGHEEACRWCGRPMTTLIDLDLSSPALSFLDIDGRRLRIATCEVCTCFDTIYTNMDLQGASSWHESNLRPDYLPEDADDWPRMLKGGLGFDEEPRHWLEAANWLVLGVRFSQVGGHPTWIQDAEYPHCPRCEQVMPFVAQISNDDLDENSEGIYSMFACRGCGVAATNYQQS